MAYTWCTCRYTCIYLGLFTQIKPTFELFKETIWSWDVLISVWLSHASTKFHEQICCTSSDAITKDACAKTWETMDIQCRPNEVILATRAAYGRMRQGRCITSNLAIGCETDVLPLVDRWCSGRRECHIELPDRELDTVNECSNDFANYLELDYLCMPGKSASSLLFSWEQNNF